MQTFDNATAKLTSMLQVGVLSVANIPPPFCASLSLAFSLVSFNTGQPRNLIAIPTSPRVCDAVISAQAPKRVKRSRCRAVFTVTFGRRTLATS